MDKSQFWTLIEDARRDASPSDQIAPSLIGEIMHWEQIFATYHRLSYTNPLWAAAYVVNGGCSDDGFDYFRGWLIAQGREVFERVTADPDALAELPVVRAAADEWLELECEEVLGIAWSAHLTATGEQLPAGAFTLTYPPLDPAWSFD